MLFVSVVALTFEYVFRLVMVKPIHIPYPEKSRSTLFSNYSTFLSCCYSARGAGVGWGWGVSGLAEEKTKYSYFLAINLKDLGEMFWTFAKLHNNGIN